MLETKRGSVHIARWDLDKTYLRTEFDTLRDLVRTAFERADEKRTNPGAMTLMREMAKSASEIHILSGSPEQMRRRLEAKLHIDGIVWQSFTLKPNLKNALRLRFRAIKDQLGYKLPMLLRARSEVQVAEDVPLPRETLFGDDAEADAFVYSLYADFVSGRVQEQTIADVLEHGNVYEDVVLQACAYARKVVRCDAVERVLIHLEGQSHPEQFRVYGPRIIPFYNYLQAAFVVYEDERIAPEAVVRVAVELVSGHRFDGDQLARSYGELVRRGHLRGARIDELLGVETMVSQLPTEAVRSAVTLMLKRLPALAQEAQARFEPQPLGPPPNYVDLVSKHNKRRKP
jgi:hypothetical protein